MKKIRVGVIGLGYWGPNYVRNFCRHNLAEVVWCCDISEHALQKIHHQYPLVKVTSSYEQILDDDTLDCVAIATPPETHYKLAKAALDANKHVLVAKPITTNLSNATELLKIAKKKKLLLHGDLTYLYTSSVKTIKDLVDKNIIGTPLYYDSIRSNAGPIRDDASVIWDLAPHDLSIIDFVFGFTPKKLFAIGSRPHKNSTTEEIAHISINYANNFVAHIHLSWLSPIKLRTTSIAGSHKMVIFDDVQMDEKLKIYDNQISTPKDEITAFKPFYRSGDIIIPKLHHEEGLFTEVDDIINQISKCTLDYQNAKLSVKIIELLEACDKSLRENRSIAL